MTTYAEAAEKLGEDFWAYWDRLDRDNLYRLSTTSKRNEIKNWLRAQLMSPPFTPFPEQLEKAIKEAKECNRANPGLATIGVTVDDLTLLLKGANTLCLLHAISQEAKDKWNGVVNRLEPVLNGVKSELANPRERSDANA